MTGDCIKYKLDEDLPMGISTAIHFNPVANPCPCKKPNTGAALYFLQPLIRYGQFSTAFSYGLHHTCSANGMDYCTRRSRFWGMFSGLFYFFTCLQLTFVVVNFQFHSYSLVYAIKRITYGIFVIKLIIVYYTLHHKGRTMGLWVKILRQADLLQEKFAQLKIYFPSNNKSRIVAVGVCLLSGFLGVLHVVVFSLSNCQDSRWYNTYANRILAPVTLGFWNETYIEVVPDKLAWVLGACGLTVELFCWNLWYFVDALRVLTALMVFTVFKQLNIALSSEKLSVENLSEIMDLHLNGTKLLNLLNQLMAPITLSSTVFNFLFICFWTNYCLLNAEFRISYIVAFTTFLRMVIVFYFVAEVNTQAFQVTTWMENHFAEMDQVPKKLDKVKLTLFTSLIYNRESIGLKGMHFFTCTPALNITIGGLVLTYTALVNQAVTH